MGCPIILTGIANDCKGMGGIRRLLLTDIANVTSVTINGTTGIVTAITMASQKTFEEYEMRDQVGGLTSTINTDEAAGTTFVTSEITGAFSKMTAAKRMEVTALSLGYVAAIVEDRNGKYWMVGGETAKTVLSPTYMTAGSGATGVNFGDANQYSVTLTNHSAELPHEVDASIISALL